jgi:hypothetical protein
MVRRLVEVADPSAEAVYCLERAELLVKSGEIADADDIMDAIRCEILSRNPRKAVAPAKLTAAPIPPAVTAAVKGLSDLERAAVKMYFVESLGENIVCSRLSIAPDQLREMLHRLRSSRGVRPNCIQIARIDQTARLVVGEE